MSRATHPRNLIALSVALLFICDVNADASDRRILPTEVEVREGEDVQVHLVKVLKNETTCYARTPLLVNCNLKHDDSENNTSCDERIHYWPVNGACGFYITGVQKQDHGLWRLTSQNDEGEKVVDVVTITVLDKFDGNLEDSVEIVKGMTYTVTFPDVNEYCIVQNPHNPYTQIVNNVCNVEIETVSATDEGTWSAIVDVRGQINEAVKKINVSVFYEHMESGYTISPDSEAIHIYCNYITMRGDNRLNLCRFTRSSINRMGLRLRDGMRKGRYEYYGNGLNVGECGLTIQSPEEEDWGPWICSLSVLYKPSITTTVDVSKPTKQIVTHGNTNKNATRQPAHTSTVSPVITTEGEVLRLECSSSELLSYCWFTEPNGKVHQITEEINNNNNNDYYNSFIGKKKIEPFSVYSQVSTYWFGNCGITIKKAEWKHNGTWICHMGPASPGLELTEKIHVRIAGTSLAAVQTFVSQSDGQITFKCKTVPRPMALNYCRFYSPTRVGINVNERVNKSNPIVHDNVRYWYNGEGLAAGDCGLVVEPASSIHEGNWTCAGDIELLQNIDEPFDIIHFVYVESVWGVYKGSDNTATTIGIVFGSLGFVIVLAVIIILGIGYIKIYRHRWWHNQDDLMRQPDDLSKKDPDRRLDFKQAK